MTIRINAGGQCWQVEKRPNGCFCLATVETDSGVPFVDHSHFGRFEGCGGLEEPLQMKNGMGWMEIPVGLNAFVVAHPEQIVLYSYVLFRVRFPEREMYLCLGPVTDIQEFVSGPVGWAVRQFVRLM